MLSLLVVLAIIACCVLSYMVWESYRYQLDLQTVELERLPASFDQTHVLFISDIHRRKIPDIVVAKCRAEGTTDLVLIGGDLREKGVPLAICRENIRKLKSIAPVYMVYGNHDYDQPIRQLEAMLQQEGVRVLMNESVLLEKKDGSQIRLTGVNDPRTKRDRLNLALGEPADAYGMFTILLAHDPLIAKRLIRMDRGDCVDLILCGHTHGGQIFLPFFGPVLRSPLPNPYLRGWYDLAEQTIRARSWSPRLFVSCGFGTSKLPIRLLAPAEVHRFTLCSKAAQTPPQ